MGPARRPTLSATPRQGWCPATVPSMARRTGPGAGSWTRAGSRTAAAKGRGAKRAWWSPRASRLVAASCWPQCRAHGAGQPVGWAIMAGPTSRMAWRCGPGAQGTIATRAWSRRVVAASGACIPQDSPRGASLGYSSLYKMCPDFRHDTCTRNHKRQRLRDVVQDVERHIQENGPWRYNLSQLYQAPEITAAVEQIAAEAQARIAA